MVAHADAEASGDPPEDDSDEEGSPAKHEERSDRADMEREHDEKRYPDDGFSESAIVSE